MTRGHPVTPEAPPPRAPNCGVSPQKQRARSRRQGHGRRRTPSPGRCPPAHPASAAAVTPPRPGDGRPRQRWSRSRRRRRKTGRLGVRPPSRGELPDFQRPGCGEPVPRVRGVQGLAPRHRGQRAALAAPLPGRAGRVPAGDRLRPRQWLLLEDHIVEKLLEKQSEARMAEWEIQQHSFTAQLAREKHVSNGCRHMGRNLGSRT